MFPHVSVEDLMKSDGNKKLGSFFWKASKAVFAAAGAQSSRIVFLLKKVNVPLITQIPCAGCNHVHMLNAGFGAICVFFCMYVVTHLLGLGSNIY